MLNISLIQAFNKGKFRDLTVKLCQAFVYQCNRQIHLRGAYVYSSSLLVQSHVLVKLLSLAAKSRELQPSQWLNGRHTFPSANMMLGVVIFSGGGKICRAWLSDHHKIVLRPSCLIPLSLILLFT